MQRLCLVAVAQLAIAAPSPLLSQAGQQFADLGTCTTVRGEVIRDCRIGYRTFGRLNARRDNAVLVPTWHGGRSETMTFILGPDRWVDTTRYFAILMDKPGNGVSISPSNSRSQPGRRFPRLTFADLVGAPPAAGSSKGDFNRITPTIKRVLPADAHAVILAPWGCA